MAIVEQGTEQRRPRADAAAALRQCQRRMFMRQQPAQPHMRLPCRRLRASPIDVQAQWQCVDKQPQCPFRAFAALQATQQYGAEHDRVSPADARQHLRPGQVAQAGQADAQPPRLTSQSQIQRRRERLVAADDLPSFTMHIAQAKRQHRLADIRQHVAEEAFMFCFAERQARLRHRIAERLGGAQLCATAGEDLADLLLHEGQRGVIANQMMPLLQSAPAAVFLLRDGKIEQRRTGQILPLMQRIKTGRQLLPNRTVSRIETPLAQRQLGLAPHHLHRRGHALRDERGAQNVMAIDHLLHRRQPGVQARTAVETQYRRQLVRIALFRQQMVEQNPLLQRRQGVDVLYVGHATRHLCHHRVDLRLAQRRQRQHLRRNGGAAR